MKRTRVRVISGDQAHDLGKGWWVENVTVYTFWDPIGQSYLTPPNPEERPGEQTIALCKTVAWELKELPDNPKIILDNGKTVYGCQVWFSSIGENE